MDGFNRTLEELKFQRHRAKTYRYNGFNRTLEELKAQNVSGGDRMISDFNRTLEELKSHCSRHEVFLNLVLIEP